MSALPHAKAKPHVINVSATTEIVVRKKYALDVRLWDLLKINNTICW